MIRVECKCTTCERNAHRLGKSLPLVAEVPATMAEAAKGNRHGLVYSAHDPSAVGVAVRRQTGLRPV